MKFFVSLLLVCLAAVSSASAKLTLADVESHMDTMITSEKTAEKAYKRALQRTIAHFSTRHGATLRFRILASNSTGINNTASNGSSYGNGSGTHNGSASNATSNATSNSNGSGSGNDSNNSNNTNANGSGSGSGSENGTGYPSNGTGNGSNYPTDNNGTSPGGYGQCINAIYDWVENGVSRCLSSFDMQSTMDWRIREERLCTADTGCIAKVERVLAICRNELAPNSDEARSLRGTAIAIAAFRSLCPTSKDSQDGCFLEASEYDRNVAMLKWDDPFATPTQAQLRGVCESKCTRKINRFQMMVAQAAGDPEEISEAEAHVAGRNVVCTSSRRSGGSKYYCFADLKALQRGENWSPEKLCPNACLRRAFLKYTRSFGSRTLRNDYASLFRFLCSKKNGEYCPAVLAKTELGGSGGASSSVGGNSMCTKRDHDAISLCMESASTTPGCSNMFNGTEVNSGMSCTCARSMVRCFRTEISYSCLETDLHRAACLQFMDHNSTCAREACNVLPARRPMSHSDSSSPKPASGICPADLGEKVQSCIDTVEANSTECRGAIAADGSANPAVPCYCFDKIIACEKDALPAGCMNSDDFVYGCRNALRPTTCAKSCDALLPPAHPGDHVPSMGDICPSNFTDIASGCLREVVAAGVGNTSCANLTLGMPNAQRYNSEVSCECTRAVAECEQARLPESCYRSDFFYKGCRAVAQERCVANGFCDEYFKPIPSPSPSPGTIDPNHGRWYCPPDTATITNMCLRQISKRPGCSVTRVYIEPTPTPIPSYTPTPTVDPSPQNGTSSNNTASNSSSSTNGSGYSNSTGSNSTTNGTASANTTSRRTVKVVSKTKSKKNRKFMATVVGNATDPGSTDNHTYPAGTTSRLELSADSRCECADALVDCTMSWLPNLCTSSGYFYNTQCMDRTSLTPCSERSCSRLRGGWQTHCNSQMDRQAMTKCLIVANNTAGCYNPFNGDGTLNRKMSCTCASAAVKCLARSLTRECFHQPNDGWIAGCKKELDISGGCPSSCELAKYYDGGDNSTTSPEPAPSATPTSSPPPSNSTGNNSTSNSTSGGDNNTTSANTTSRLRKPRKRSKVVVVAVDASSSKPSSYSTDTDIANTKKNRFIVDSVRPWKSILSSAWRKRSWPTNRISFMNRRKITARRGLGLLESAGGESDDDTCAGLYANPPVCTEACRSVALSHVNTLGCCAADMALAFRRMTPGGPFEDYRYFSWIATTAKSVCGLRDVDLSRSGMCPKPGKIAGKLVISGLSSGYVDKTREDFYGDFAKDMSLNTGVYAGDIVVTDNYATEKRAEEQETSFVYEMNLEDGESADAVLADLKATIAAGELDLSTTAATAAISSDDISVNGAASVTEESVPSPYMSPVESSPETSSAARVGVEFLAVALACVLVLF